VRNIIPFCIFTVGTVLLFFFMFVSNPFLTEKSKDFTELHEARQKMRILSIEFNEARQNGAPQEILDAIMARMKIVEQEAEQKRNELLEKYPD